MSSLSHNQLVSVTSKWCKWHAFNILRALSLCADTVSKNAHHRLGDRWQLCCKIKHNVKIHHTLYIIACDVFTMSIVDFLPSTQYRTLSRKWKFCCCWTDYYSLWSVTELSITGEKIYFITIVTYLWIDPIIIHYNATTQLPQYLSSQNNSVIRLWQHS